MGGMTWPRVGGGETGVGARWMTRSSKRRRRWRSWIECVAFLRKGTEALSLFGTALRLLVRRQIQLLVSRLV